MNNILSYVVNSFLNCYKKFCIKNKERIYKELLDLKQSVVHVIKDRDEIITEYGSMDNFYMSNFKQNMKKNHPYICEFIKSKKGTFERYDGNIDKYFIDLFSSSKDRIVELYGNLAYAIIVPSGNFMFDYEIDKECELANETIKVYDKVFGVLDFYCDFFDINKDYNLYYSQNKTKKTKRRKFTDNEIIYYSRKVIEDIEPSLLDEYDSFINDNLLKIKNRSIFVPKMIKDSRTRLRLFKKQRYIKSIELIRDNTIDDIVTLVHEFMHVLSNSTKRKHPKIIYWDESQLRHKDKKYTEFISIYFEYYAINYLKEKFQLSEEETTNYERNLNNRLDSKDNIMNFIPFKIYKEYGEYNFDNYTRFIDDNNVPIKPTLTTFQVITNKLNSSAKWAFEEINYIKTEKTEDFWDFYFKDIGNALKENLYEVHNHFLGSLLYYRTKGKYTKKDILKLSKLISKGDFYDLADNDVYKSLEEEYKLIMKDNTSLRNLDNLLLDSKKKRGAL